MTVNWEDFLDVKEAFLINRVEVNDSLNTLTDAVSNVPTTDDIVIALASDQAFKDSVKGDDGEPCTVERLGTNNGIHMNCNGSETNIWDGVQGMAGAAGEAGEAGEDGEDGESCQAVATPTGVNIVCKDSVQFLATGQNGEDGQDCSVVDDGVNATITCGGASATVEGVDEGGIITAIGAQTTALTDALSYGGELPSSGLAMTQGLTDAIGTPNDYEVRNYGTVMEASVTQIKEGALYIAVDEFFEVSFSGSCPSYSADIPFMATSITVDHWCRPIMSEIWPMIQAIIILGFSFLAFRVAVL
jgi:hypothetical protein